MKWIRNLAALAVGASLATYWAWSQALVKVGSLVPVHTDEQRRASLAEVPSSLWQEGDIVRFKGGDENDTLVFIDHGAHDEDLFLAEHAGGFGYFSKSLFVLHELNQETRGV